MASTSTSSTTGSRRPSVVATLRDLMPERPLGFHESLRLAELQANRFLEHFACDGPPFSDELIRNLPRIEVKEARLINAGLTTWSRGKWRVRIGAADAPTRKRFTLAHELKHILDASVEQSIYGHLPAGPARTLHIEAICNHFAACLLMPRRRLHRLWGAGVQDLDGLAWRFDVSPQAMLVRLQSIGLVGCAARCSTERPVARRRPGRGSRSQRRFYARSARIKGIPDLAGATP